MWQVTQDTSLTKVSVSNRWEVLKVDPSTHIVWLTLHFSLPENVYSAFSFFDDIFTGHRILSWQLCLLVCWSYNDTYNMISNVSFEQSVVSLTVAPLKVMPFKNFLAACIFWKFLYVLCKRGFFIHPVLDSKASLNLWIHSFIGSGKFSDIIMSHITSVPFSFCSSETFIRQLLNLLTRSAIVLTTLPGSSSFCLSVQDSGWFLWNKFFLQFFGGFFWVSFWLRWVFVAARRLSLLVASGGYSSLRCVGFSLQWLFLLQITGSSVRASVVAACGLSSRGAWT